MELEPKGETVFSIEDRWWRWRVTEPDPEYLRRGRRRRLRTRWEPPAERERVDPARFGRWP